MLRDFGNPRPCGVWFNASLGGPSAGAFRICIHRHLMHGTGMQPASLPLRIAAVTALLLPALPAIAQQNPKQVDRAAISQAGPAKAYAQPKKPRTVLVFSVTRGFHHSSIPWGVAAIEEMGKRTGAYTAVTSDDPANFEADALAKFDAVVFNNTTQSVFLPDKKEFDAMDAAAKQAATQKAKRLQQNLLAFVRSGKGFIGIHAATDTLYDFPEYGSMVGGYFDGHPWTADVQVSVKVADPAHPINQGMKDITHLEFCEECYQFRDPYRADRLHVLLRLDTDKTDMTRPGIKRTDKDFALSWVRMFGEGRVFYCALGHNEHIYLNRHVLSHYFAGIQWALGDLPAPTPPGDK